MVKQVSIKIKGGQISADFKGFVGRECQRLEERIRVEGLNVEDSEAKPELYQETLSETNSENS